MSNSVVFFKSSKLISSVDNDSLTFTILSFSLRVHFSNVPISCALPSVSHYHSSFLIHPHLSFAPTTHSLFRAKNVGGADSCLASAEVPFIVPSSFLFPLGICIFLLLFRRSSLRCECFGPILSWLKRSPHKMLSSETRPNLSNL